MSYDLLAAGTSIKPYADIVSWDGIFQAAPYRGNDLIIPSRNGHSFAAKVRDAYTFSVPLLLRGTSQAVFQDNLDTLRRLTDTTVAALTLSRVKPSAGGDVTTTCTASCLLSEVGMVNGLLIGRLVLDVTNLDGCWFGAAVSPTIPATISVAGTTRTHKMTIVLPGAGTLTNTTLGVSLAVTAGATLTVHTQSTSGSLAAITAAGDPLGNWFALAPGNNTITWSGGGTPTLTYYPAYL